MPDEVGIYRQELSWVLAEFRQCIGAYQADQLHWRPADGANSAAAIVMHVVGATRVYVLGFACGQPVERDRAAEFRPEALGAPALLAALDALAREIDAALAELTPAALARSLRPPQELWGATTETREIVAREALVMALRHAAIHLGELRLTHDLAAAGR